MAPSDKKKTKAPARTSAKGPANRRKVDWVSRPIVLVGLMGAGKTTIGRRLARALSLRFVDSDQEIEKAANLSIAEIFEIYGESEFRALERRVISRLMDGKPKVIATGGGAFMNDETRALVLKDAVTLWLEADLEVLVERTSRRNTRPLLLNTDPAEVLGRLMAERYPIYSQAALKVQSDPGPHKKVVADSMQILKTHFQKNNAAPKSRKRKKAARADS